MGCLSWCTLVPEGSIPSQALKLLTDSKGDIMKYKSKKKNSNRNHADSKVMLGMHINNNAKLTRPDEDFKGIKNIPLFKTLAKLEGFKQKKSPKKQRK